MCVRNLENPQTQVWRWYELSKYNQSKVGWCRVLPVWHFSSSQTNKRGTLVRATNFSTAVYYVDLDRYSIFHNLWVKFMPDYKKYSTKGAQTQKR